VVGEYCWVITLAAGRSCCGPTVSSVLESGLQLDSLSIVYCMYICNVCMFVCVYVYMYVCMYICNVCMYVCMFVCVYVYMYVCMYVYM